MDFKSAVELLELCRQTQCPISEVMRRRECELGETTRDQVDHRMAKVLEIMRASATQPLKKPSKSMGGLIGGESKKLYDHAARGKAIFQTLYFLPYVTSVIAIGMQIAVRGFAWMIGICIALAAVCLLVFVIYLNMYWRTRLRILDIRSAQNEQKADAENASDL